MSKQDNEAFKAALEDFGKNHPTFDSYALQAFSAGWLAKRNAASPPGDGGLLRDAMKLLDVAGMWKAPVDEQWRMSYADVRARYDAAPAWKEGE